MKIATGSNAPFAYVRESLANVDVVTGDARLLMEREAAQDQMQHLDVLALDAYGGDDVKNIHI